MNKEEFSVIGLLKAIPAMTRKVWPGLWPLVLIVSASLYFGSPEHLDVLSFSDWAVLHTLILFGMLSLTIWLYNTFERPVVNMAVIGLWLMASAFCYLSDLILKS
jgi:hypothetical protein